MLSPLDDYPVHQAATPLAHPVDGDPNRYDRYFFHGYDLDRRLFVGATLGLYPNRHLMDAAFAVGDGRTQRSVFASRRAPLDRRETTVGPIRVEVVEPLRVLRVVVDAPDQGLAGDLTFTARTVALEEPRQSMVNRTRVILDSTRLTQWGRWTGTVTTAGETVDLGDGIAGTRDRSWGIRPLAGAAPEAPDTELPAFFWLWAPLHLDDRCLHVAVMSDQAGHRSTDSGSILADVAGGPTWGPDARASVEHAVATDFTIDWRTGTRRAKAADLRLTRPDGKVVEAHLEAVFPFLVRGLGYSHPEWAHGTWHGEEAVGGEVLDIDEQDPLDLANIHVHQVCRVTVGDGPGGRLGENPGGRLGEIQGVGVLEQLHVGPHDPTGLPGFLDGAR